MVKSFIKVYIRVRPTSQPTQRLSVGNDGCTVSVGFDKHEHERQKDTLSFKYDGYLENATQESIYNDCAADVVDNVLTGYNGTIFCYGQTGAGKTFTMAGDPKSYQQRGIIPRTIHQIFREIDLRVDRMYKVWVTYLEIYNEMMYDLLSDSPGSTELHVIEENNVTKVRGLSMREVRSEEEALGMFFMGEAGRSTAQHVLNSNSSRSHCIFTVHLEMRGSSDASERAIKSKVNLVDLAGSERTKKTNVTGQTLKEASFINKSLSFLEQTVNALAKKAGHVPFRQSKLTSVLRDALGGNCKTVMLANIWGEGQHMEETVSTLRFAARVKLIQTDAMVNESQDLALQVERYRRQIKELKQELTMRDALSGRGRISYEDLNDQEQMELMALCKRFLEGGVDVEELPQDTMKLVRECFKQMRNVYQSMQSQMAAGQGDDTAGRTSGGLAAELSAEEAAAAADMVGEDDKLGTTGFAIGKAPPGAAPEAGEGEEGAEGPPSPVSKPRTPLRHEQGQSAAPSLFGAPSAVSGDADRNSAFLRFKRENAEGRALADALAAAQREAGAAKAAVKELAVKVNSAKGEIDRLNSEVASRRAAAGQGGGAIDAEEYELLSQLKSAKLAYRTVFDQLKDLKAALEVAVTTAGDARARLVEAFQGWYEEVGAMEAPPAELDPDEEYAAMQAETWRAADPDAAAYLSAKKGSKAYRPGVAGGDKGRAATIRRRDMLQ